MLMERVESGSENIQFFTFLLMFGKQHCHWTQLQ